MATDAFGRFRVSEPFTIFQYAPNAISQYTAADEDIWKTDVVADASANYDPSGGYVSLTCNTSGDIVTRQTKVPMEYQPGKSRLVYMSGVPFTRSKATGEALECRMGIFCVADTAARTPREGHYFYSNGTTLYWSETYDASEATVAQSSWNIDTFNGSGPSGQTLTSSALTKNVLLVIDQEYLGVGRVRCGFKIDGVIYYAHAFTHGTIARPFTSTSMLPLVYQLKATTLSSSISLKQICCTCLSEGGFTPAGRLRSVSTPVAGVTLASADRKYVLLALRIRSGVDCHTLKLKQMSVLFPSASATKWAKVELQLHSSVGSVGTLNAAMSSFSAAPYSAGEYAVGDGSGNYVSSDGIVVTSLFASTSSTLVLSKEDFETMYNGLQVTPYDTLYVIVSLNTTNSAVAASIDFLD
jgi:hypothetical protein